MTSLQSPLLENLERPGTITAVNTDDDATEQRGNANGNVATKISNEQYENQAPLPWSAFRSCPAPMFAIDQEMRIVFWSPGECVFDWCCGFLCRHSFGAVLLNRDVGLCPVDHGPTQSASRDASLCVYASEQPVSRSHSPGFRRYDRRPPKCAGHVAPCHSKRAQVDGDDRQRRARRS